MLTVANLNVAYHGIVVVQDVSLTVSAGTLVAIVGPNGAGKTTLLKALVGLVPRVSGVVTLFGKPFSAHHNLVAYVPQRSGIDWHFPITVFELVLMGCYGRLGFLRRPSEHEHERARNALAAVDLLACADDHIGSLSGGQQQRALVARALMQDAQLYLMDEPLAGVDVMAQKTIMNLLQQLRAHGKAVIVVHHQVEQVHHYFDQALLFNRTCVAYGPPATVLEPSMLQITYCK